MEWLNEGMNESIMAIFEVDVSVGRLRSSFVRVRSTVKVGNPDSIHD
jgi:hypothetical protein